MHIVIVTGRLLLRGALVLISFAQTYNIVQLNGWNIMGTSSDIRMKCTVKKPGLHKFSHSKPKTRKRTSNSESSQQYGRMALIYHI